MPLTHDSTANPAAAQQREKCGSHLVSRRRSSCVHPAVRFCSSCRRPLCGMHSFGLRCSSCGSPSVIAYVGQLPWYRMHEVERIVADAGADTTLARDLALSVVTARGRRA